MEMMVKMVRDSRLSSAAQKPILRQLSRLERIKTNMYLMAGRMTRPGTSALWPHEFASQRRKINGVWGSFSAPALWANYSFDGDDAYSVALSSYESIITLNSKGGD